MFSYWKIYDLFSSLSLSFVIESYLFIYRVCVKKTSIRSFLKKYYKENILIDIKFFQKQNKTNIHFLKKAKDQDQRKFQSLHTWLLKSFCWMNEIIIIIISILVSSKYFFSCLVEWNKTKKSLKKRWNSKKQRNSNVTQMMMKFKTFESKTFDSISTLIVWWQYFRFGSYQTKQNKRINSFWD